MNLDLFEPATLTYNHKEILMDKIPNYSIDNPFIVKMLISQHSGFYLEKLTTNSLITSILHYLDVKKLTNEFITYNDILPFYVDEFLNRFYPDKYKQTTNYKNKLFNYIMQKGPQITYQGNVFDTYQSIKDLMTTISDDGFKTIRANSAGFDLLIYLSKNHPFIEASKHIINEISESNKNDYILSKLFSELINRG